MIKIENFSFQGINGAYSELAGKNIFPEADSLACATFEEMFQTVREGKANVAIVPIENSQAGRVADTQRLIPNSQLKIIGEYFLEIKHCLMGIQGTTLETIKRVHSHEQAIAQCRDNLIRHDKEMKVEADTAGSAKLVSEWNNIEDAAIASELAAQIYNLNIIDSNFQDTSYNVTRFLVMSKDMANYDKDLPNLITTLVFKVRSLPAALYKSLGGFATNQINMTKLESFSVKNTFAQTNFYLDFEGHLDDKPVQNAMEELGFHTERLDILGVYEASKFRQK